MQTQPTQPATLREATSRFNGSPEVRAEWLASHLRDVTLVDVREPHELTGPLGCIEAARNIPLNTVLKNGIGETDGRPVVVICRSGRRSAVAVEALERAGLDPVASVEGGMLAWNAQVLHRASIYEDEKHENAVNLRDAIDRTNGVPEVSATWVHANLGRFDLVDVRAASERLGPMGAIVQAQHVPLGALMEAAADWPRDRAIVIHCASGGRSARAAMALEQAGFTRVASMEGGMMAWRGYGLP